MIKVLRNFSQLLTLENAHKKDGRNLTPDDCSILYNASIVHDNDQILWVGIDSNIPDQYKSLEASYHKDQVLIPEIVDSHTHLVFAGNRSVEYVKRLNGYSYEEIANGGGGILFTCNETCKTPLPILKKLAIDRINKIASLGVGTIEVKSGYGLTFEKELEISQLISELKREFHPKIQIFNTFMAAHAIPKNFNSSSSYLSKIVLPLLRELHDQKQIDAVDIFHEVGYFSMEDVKKVFSLAKDLGIPRKMHADEFQDNQGLNLAIEFDALSADHLIMSNPQSILKLNASNTVATMLPGTGLFLGKNLADARSFLDAGAKVAIASDYNPGSCHFDNLITLANLAAPKFKMNFTELWSAITLNAAHALGMKDQGALIKGLRPRFSIFNTEKIENINYFWGENFFNG